MEATRGNSCALLAVNMGFNDAHLSSPASLLWNSGCLAGAERSGWPRTHARCQFNRLPPAPTVYKTPSPTHSRHVLVVTTPPPPPELPPHNHPRDRHSSQGPQPQNHHFLTTAPQLPPLHMCHLVIAILCSIPTTISHLPPSLSRRLHAHERFTA